MWEFLLYVIPWYVQVAVVALFVAVMFLVAVKIFGWERVRRYLLPVAALLGAGALLSRSRQAGWKDKAKRDMREADKLIDKSRETRKQAEKDNADPKRLRDDDGFRRD